jgi:glutamate carboxypeptidase
MSDDLIAWAVSETPWVRETIASLVRLESPSIDKAAVDRCGDALAESLRALGASVSRLPAEARGDHVLARIDGGPSHVLLLGHIDTVWPVGQLSAMPLREENGRLFGPGVFDMKAGIGVALLAVRALLERSMPHRPTIRMLFTTDEEIGSGTSRATIEATSLECQAVLVLEPSLPGGAAKTSRKGCGEFQLVVHGVAAHAGLDPGRGASAIHELAHQITHIAALQNVERGVTVNVGQVSGGTRTNVVADRAVAAIDVRVPTMMDAAAIEARLRGLQPSIRGTRLELVSAAWRPPLERTAGVVRLYSIAREVARELGQDLHEGGAGGGSDGNFTAAVGVPTLDGLGPRGDGAHALHEHVDVSDLAWRAAFLASLLSRLGRVQ